MRKAVCALLLCFTLQGCSTTAEEKEKKIEAIDKEINDLEKKLASYRVEEMNAEIQGQGYFLAEPHEFIEDLERAKKDESEVEKIQKKIDELLKQKEAIHQKKSY